MKITRLWISQYKNLKDIELQFDEGHFITLFIGQNGLGKSNFIEILTLIFRDLLAIDDYEDFAQWATSGNQFEYEIEYHCKGKNLRISCRDDKFEVAQKEQEEGNYTSIPFTDFIKNRRLEYLPSYIITYYSGKNERFEELVKGEEEEERDRFRFAYGILDQEEEEVNLEDVEQFRYLFYAENHHSQLLLLTLALYQNSVIFGEKIKELLGRYLKINGIEEFEIRFKSPVTYSNGDNELSSKEERAKEEEGQQRGRVDYLISNISNGMENPFWGLHGKIDELLTLFYDHAIGKGTSPVYYQEDEELDIAEEIAEAGEDSNVREFLEFNDIDFTTFHQGLDQNEKHPLDFFNALETADFIDVLDEIRFKVDKEGVEELIEFSDLSEGEQQLLAVVGLLLVTSKEDSLYLLDEPDTHLNPIWQRDYVDVLKNFTLSPENSHIFMATHSPLIVQSSKASNVVLFYEEEPGNIITEVSEIPFHRWRTDHVLTSKYFGLESARPKDENIDFFMKRRAEILEKKIITAEDKAFLESHVDEGGLLPSGETFRDLEAMQYIRETARKFQSDGKTR